jgi:hypothetical protein
MTDDEVTYLDARNVARMLGVLTNTVHAMHRVSQVKNDRGDRLGPLDLPLPAFRASGGWRWSSADITAFLFRRGESFAARRRRLPR